MSNILDQLGLGDAIAAYDEAEKKKSPSVVDLARAALAGYVGDTARGLGYALEATDLAPEHGRRMREAGDWFVDEQSGAMTPGGRRAFTSPVVEGEGILDLALADKWGQSALMGVARSLPQMAMTAVPGMPVAGALTAGTRAVAPSLYAEGAKGIAPWLAKWLPAGVGYGGAEGLQAGAINAADTKTEIEKTLAKTRPTMPAEERIRIAEQAAAEVFKRTALSTGTIGALTGGGAMGMLDRLERGARDGLIKSTLKGAATEALQETPQSGGEAYIQNLAKRDYLDPTLDPMKGVAAQALEGGIVGGLSGGMVGGAGRIATPRTGDEAGGTLVERIRSILGDSLAPAPAPSIEPEPTVRDYGSVGTTRGVATSDTDEQQQALTRPGLEQTALERVEDLRAELDGLVANTTQIGIEGGSVPIADAGQQIARLKSEIETLSSTFPEMTRGTETQFGTEAGTKLKGTWAVAELDSLVPSHDPMSMRENRRFPQTLQPRDRSAAGYELQVQSMASRLDPARLGESPEVTTGAPIVGADGIVESGNGRVMAIARAYNAEGDQAKAYRAWLKEQAPKLGFEPLDIEKMKAPVLVRVRDTKVNRAEFARQANAPTTAQLSPIDQAKSDAQRMGKMLQGLEVTEDGDVFVPANNGVIKQFFAMLPLNEQTALVDAKGRITEPGQRRFLNALAVKAYGEDSPAVMRMVGSMNDDMRNLSKALVRAAPRVARAREELEGTDLASYDITGLLIGAVEELVKAREQGMTIADLKAQREMFGDAPAEFWMLIEFLDANLRAPRRIAQFIEKYLEEIGKYDGGGTVDMFGGKTAPERAALVKTAQGAVDEAPTETADAGAAPAAPNAAPAAPVSDAAAAPVPDAGQPKRGRGGEEVAGPGAVATVKPPVKVSTGGEQSKPKGEKRDQPKPVPAADQAPAEQQPPEKPAAEAAPAVAPSASAGKEKADRGASAAKGKLAQPEGVGDAGVVGAETRGDLVGTEAGAVKEPSGVNVKAEPSPSGAKRDAASTESGLDVLPPGTDLGANILQTHPRVIEGFGALDVEGKRAVKTLVIRAVKNLEIRKRIVEAVSIDVMNDLVGGERPAERMLNDLPMLTNTLASADLDSPVLASLVDALVARAAARGTEVPPPRVSNANEGDTASDASQANNQGYGSTNKVFTADAAERARRILRGKLGQFNTGLDPEIVQAGITLAGWHIEAGARSFAAYSAKMIGDLGEAVRPYLKSWYLAVRNYPGFDSKGMQSEAELDAGEQVGKQPTEQVGKQPAKQPTEPAKPDLTQALEDARRKLNAYNVSLSTDMNMGGETFLTASKDGKQIPALHGTNYTEAGIQEVVAWVERKYSKLAALYRGGSPDGAGRITWLTPDRAAADQYAGLNAGGKVTEHSVEGKKLAGPEDVQRVASEAGIDLQLDTQQSAYSVLASEQFKDADRLIDALQKAGYDGVRLPMGEDFAPNGKAIESVGLFKSSAPEGEQGRNRQWWESELTQVGRAEKLKEAGIKRGPSIRWIYLAPNEQDALLALRETPKRPVTPQVEAMPGTAPLGAKPAAPALTLKDMEEQGEQAFKAGQERRAPRSIWEGLPAGKSGLPSVQGGAKANAMADAWYRGWDRANLAAPVPELEAAPVEDASAAQEKPLDEGVATPAAGGTLTGKDVDEPTEQRPAETGDREGDRGARPAGGTGSRPLAGGLDEGNARPGKDGQAPAGGTGASGPRSGDLFGGETGRGEQPPGPPRADGDVRARPGAAGVTKPKPTDYTITDADRLGEGTPKQKYRDNVAAIRALRALEAEQRAATPEEQRALVRYVGWGGLKGAFDDADKGWTKEYAELKELLTDEEYAAARRTILDAHYTSVPVVRGIYAIAKRLGFTHGRILEPSAGSGNFIGLMPLDARSRSALTAVELDQITGRIARALYPKANIVAGKGFQEVKIPEGYFDLAVGNPPFGSQEIFDPERPTLRFSIHNFFFAKSIESLRPGGILSMVVSRYFLDVLDPKARKWIAERAKLVGAIRLPETAFKQNAGTEVVTDILVFQKLKEGEKPDPNAAWLDTTDVELPRRDDKTQTEKVPINGYFAANPEMVLGQHELGRGIYRDNELIVSPKAGESIEAGLARLLSKFPEGIYEHPKKRIEVLMDVDGIVPEDVKVGGYFVPPSGGIARRLADTMGKRQLAKIEVSDKVAERIRAMIEVRDALRKLLRAELTDEGNLGYLRTVLNNRYDAFEKKYGYFNATYNRSILADDPDLPLLESLEPEYDPGISSATAKKHGIPMRAPKAGKADIFTKRVLKPYDPVTKADSPVDALNVSLSERGRVDMDFMGNLTGADEATLVKELKGLVYRDPEAGYVTSDEYLSGNVKAKLAAARAAAEREPAFKDNVEALQAVQPKDVEPLAISVRLGSPWVPAADIEAFALQTLKVRPKVAYLPSVAQWSVHFASSNATTFESTYGTARKPADSILELLLNLKPVEVKDNVGTSREPKYVLNEEETRAAQAKAEELARAFKDWIWSDEERRDRLARVYNDTYNTDVLRKRDGAYLVLPGMNPEIKLRKHQKDGIARIIQDRRVLLDQVVGAGKTYEIIAAIMEMRRIGLMRKPVIPVPNHLVRQWRDEFYKLYPNANILAATERDFEKANRQRLFGRVATGDWDAVIVGHSSFKKIGMPEEAQRDIIGEMLRDLEEAIEQAKRDKGQEGKRLLKEMEKIKTTLKERMARLADTGAKDTVATLDELGVDGLFVDEAHAFKNLFYFSQMRGVAGLGNPEGSERAFDLFVKMRWLQGQKGVTVFATGTPVSNSLVEMYTMQRYMMYDEMKESGTHLLDGWANVFGDVQQVYEVHPSGNGYRLATRFAQFVNLPELMQAYKGFADVITLPDLKQQAKDRGERFPVPKVKGGKPELRVSNRSELQTQFFGVPEFVRDAEGNLVFELGGHADEYSVVQGTDGKWGINQTQDGKPYAVRAGFETEAEAQAALETGLRTPRTQYNEGSILWKFDNLKSLLRETKGKVNPLSITNEARKAALDYRLIDPSAPDFAGSKVNDSAENIVRIWKDWSDDRGTQLVFCDLSVPASARSKLKAKAKEQGDLDEAHKAAEDRAREAGDEVTETTGEESDAIGIDQLLALQSTFSVYDALKAKLIEKGIPAADIAFIHDYDTAAKKQKLFGEVRAGRGRVRVLMGSTEKLGAGTNVQDRLVALHHLDAPWRPSDLEQREGRIIRQGNKLYQRDPEGFEVEIIRYATEKTYDTRMWQIIEHKANGVEQLRKAGADARTIDDIGGEAANAADMKAAASGNPLILEEIKLRNEVKSLEAQKASWQRSLFDLQNRRRRLSEGPVRLAARLAELDEWIAVRDKNPSDGATVAIDGETHKKEGAGGAITRKLAEAAQTKSLQPEPAGEYRGLTFGFSAGMESLYGYVRLPTHDHWRDLAHYGKNDKFSAAGFLVRIDNALAGMEDDKAAAEAHAASEARELKEVEAELAKPFAKEEELVSKRRRHGEISRKLSAAGGAIEMSAEMKAQYAGALRARGIAEPKFSPEEGLPGAPERGTLRNDAEARADLDLLEHVLAKYSSTRSVPGGLFRPVRLPDDQSLQAVAAAFGKRVLGVRVDEARAPARSPVLIGWQGVSLPGVSDVVVLREDARRPHLAIIGHELAHTLARENPRLYTELVDAVRPYVRDSEYLNGFVAQFDAGKSGAYIREEFVGEVLSDGFMSERFWDALGKESPTLLERVIKALRALMEKAARSLGYRPKTAQYLSDFDAVMEIAGRVMARYADQGKAREATGGDAKFASSRAGEITRKAKVESVQRRIVEAFGPEAQGLFDTGLVTVVDQRDELPTQRLRDYASANDEAIHDTTARGGEGGIFFIASQIAPERVVPVLLHELGEHQGLPKLLGARYSGLQDDVRAAHAVGKNAALEEAWAFVAENYPKLKDGDATFVSEVIAKVGETAAGRRLPFYRRILTAVREWLRSIGVRVEVSDDDLAGLVAAAARAQIKGLARIDTGAYRYGDTIPEKPALAASRRPENEGQGELIAGTIDPHSTSGQRRMQADIRRGLGDYLQSAKTFNWWHRSIGTQYHKAQVDTEYFKPVFDKGQEYLTDVTLLAMEAEKEAQGLLPRIESIGDLKKRAPSKEVFARVSRALFEGTLAGRNPEDGRVWSPGELRRRFGLTDEEIRLYRQARAAVDRSIEQVAKSTVGRIARTYDIKLDKDMGLEDLVATVHEQLEQKKLDVNLRIQAAGDTAGPTKAEETAREAIDTAMRSVNEIGRRTRALQKGGYMPLMRFGRYAVDVTKGKRRVYFSLYETEAEANRVARALRAEHGDGTIVEVSVMSAEAYKLFRGINPDALEAFADIAGIDEHPLIQQWLQVAVSNRSALKRMIERKAVPGYSEDLMRVLSQFITSNARLAASNWHHADMMDLVEAISQEKGDVKDEAYRLYAYLVDPVEEAAALRGYLFFHFMGGSLAAAIVNMTQPIMMTAPYLTQFADAATVTAQLTRAMREGARTGFTDDAAGRAAAKALESGLIAPHEIYQLMASARGGVGRSRFLHGLTRTWGGFFSLAEAWNRKSTFLAAYRIAEKKGEDDPFAFARKAVEETQGLYNRGNRPNWARGVIGAPIFTFKQFSIAYLEWFKRMPKPQKLAALAMLFLASGLQGLPGSDDLDDILDTLGQWMGYDANMKRAKREALEAVIGEGGANFVMHGISAIPGMPLDVQARLGLGNLLPGTALLKPSEQNKGRDALEFLGPTGGLARSAGQAIESAAKGDAGGAVQAVLPKALADLAKAASMFATGQYKDTKGRLVTDADGLDSFVKAVGFQPAHIAAKTRRVQEVLESVNLHKVVEAGIADRWARGLAEGDDDAVASAREELADWNSSNPSVPIRIEPNQIRQRVKAIRATRADRIFKTTPREMRGAVREALTQ